MDLFAASIDSFHQSGATTNLARVLARLLMFFGRTRRPDVAATLYGASDIDLINMFTGFAAAVDHVRNELGTDAFDNCARTGAAMTVTEAVDYAHHQIQLARQQQP